MNKEQLFARLKKLAPGLVLGRTIDDFTEEQLRAAIGEAARTQDLPLVVREAPIGVIDVKARTVDIVWSTGARVKRYDWSRDTYYMEELSLDPGHVRMGRLQNGAPLLNTHSRWSLGDVIGVVDTASIARGEGLATVRFSSRDDVEPIFRDVQDKIIRNVSVGYAIYRMEQLPPDANSEGLPVYRAIDWEPQELSFVPIGADAGAGSRGEEPQRTFSCEFLARESTAVAAPPIPGASASQNARKEPSMSKEQLYGLLKKLAPKKLEGRSLEDVTEADLVRWLGEIEVRAELPAATPAPDAAQRGSEEIIAAERARVTTIQGLVRQHSLDEALATRLVDSGATVESARSAVLDALAARSAAAPVGSGNRAEIVTDETVVRREAIATALLHRHNPRAHQLNDASRQYRGYTLIELARDSLEQAGIRTRGMTRMEIATRTFQSTSDLPAVFLDAANKSLRAAYESTPRTFVPWTRQTTAPDFKNINRVQLSGAPSLLEIKSGGEYKRGAVTDGKETYQLTTYGRIMGFNRQALINDDLDALTRMPELAARAAADLESDTVWGVLIANANLGVDSTALFHANHNNLTSSGTAIAVASLGVARKTMRLQTGLEGRLINVNMQYLLVPATQETLAQQYTSADFVSAKSSDINPFKSKLAVIAEPRLDANSTTAWYGAADPAQVDTIEYAYLEGQEGVYMETKMGWDIDGLEMKVRLDFAAKALDFRGLYKNVGA